MKKVVTFLLTVLLCIPFVVFAEEEKAKVKVYLFESGGCPCCEAEREYLEGLDSYNKKFEIVSKELYIDHIDWEEGKDYDLGVQVAEEFNKAGFKDASYKGTPFVVISDIYGAATYSTDLERYIDKAYEEGDRDAVSCIMAGQDDCVRFNEEEESDSSNQIKGGAVILVLGGMLLVGAFAYIYANKKKSSRAIVDDFEEDKEEKPLKKESTKVVTKTEKEKNKSSNKTTKTKTTKKPTTKKPTTKKVNKNK